MLQRREDRERVSMQSILPHAWYLCMQRAEPYCLPCITRFLQRKEPRLSQNPSKRSWKLAQEGRKMCVCDLLPQLLIEILFETQIPAPTPTPGTTASSTIDLTSQESSIQSALDVKPPAPLEVKPKELKAKEKEAKPKKTASGTNKASKEAATSAPVCGSPSIPRCSSDFQTTRESRIFLGG